MAEGKTVRIIDQYFDNFADAVEVANQNGGGTVLLLADTVATNDPQKTATIGFRTSIIVKSEGDVPLIIYRAPGQTGPMLAMTDGTVSLKNVVFDGAGEGVAAPAITISDQAVVKFGKGLTVCNNASDGSASGKLAASAVSVSGKDASLTLKEGCAVENNAGSGPVEAAVYNDGATVVNEGAAFAGNTAEAGENHDYAGTGKLKGEEDLRDCQINQVYSAAGGLWQKKLPYLASRLPAEIMKTRRWSVCFPLPEKVAFFGNPPSHHAPYQINQLFLPPL